MLAALDEFLADMPGVRWQRPTGGLYVWLELPEGMDAGPGGTLIEHALDEGVLVRAGRVLLSGARANRCRKDRIRLSFGVQSTENIRRGVEALARAIRRSL